MYIETFAQISPGDLTNAHAVLEGLSNCTKCHVIGEQVNNTKCLDCHSEIKALIASGIGYHSSPDVKGKNCFACHSEHHGRNFRIINFNKSNFDHNKTGFTLKGQHQKEDCSSCHNFSLIKNSIIKKRKNTYLGLDTRCISCHEDYHQNTLNNDCSSCHNVDKFKPAVGFTHDKASFKLTGSHIKTDCIKCHPKEKKNNRDYQQFKGVAFNSCANCHKDVHQGKFGKDCKSCHSTVSFRNINQAAFNHDKTNYPLEGRHQIVSCNVCHKNDLNSKPKHDRCIDCHLDFHKGDFTTTQGAARDCIECHNVNGFTPSMFTIEQHDKSKFSLTGGHLAIPCLNCHLSNNEYHFRFSGTGCIDCHKNVHGTEIKALYMKSNDCTSCHQTASWKIINFDHNKTNFRLSGKHSKLLCTSCHLQNNNFIFASIKKDCENCHKDIHYGQFKENQVTDCVRCHSFDDWTPANFEHNKTRFSLEGAHSKVSCAACHKKTENNGYSYIKYKLQDFKCAACHH